MSYNQKPQGPGGSSTGVGGGAGSGGSGGGGGVGPSTQTPQQVAKTLAGIQQQMQSLVHSQNALPQSAQAADFNAFFQQQRFQTMLKQQQQQLLLANPQLQQHFQQQMQQQNKERGEPLALTRTPAAAELLNKTYQHHQQQANGSSTPSPTLASVNQQIQQQLQSLPNTLMQQIQAYQYQMQQQQQQQQQQQHQHQQQQQQQQVQQHTQHQQHTHTQSQIQQKTTHALTTAAAALQNAAHIQQMQQTFQHKYLAQTTAAAAAHSHSKINTAPPSHTPPPNQIKPPNLPPSTQITPIPPPSQVQLVNNTSIGVSSKSSSSQSPLTSSSVSSSKQVTPSISLISTKSALQSPPIAAHQNKSSPVLSMQNQYGNVVNKTPMVSAIPSPFPTHYQKPNVSPAGGNSVTTISASNTGSQSPLSQISNAKTNVETMKIQSTAVSLTKQSSNPISSPSKISSSTNLSVQKSLPSIVTPVQPVPSISVTKTSSSSLLAISSTDSSNNAYSSKSFTAVTGKSTNQTAAIKSSDNGNTGATVPSTSLVVTATTTMKPSNSATTVTAASITSKVEEISNQKSPASVIVNKDSNLEDQHSEVGTASAFNAAEQSSKVQVNVEIENKTKTDELLPKCDQKISEDQSDENELNKSIDSSTTDMTSEISSPTTPNSGYDFSNKKDSALSVENNIVSLEKFPTLSPKAGEQNFELSTDSVSREKEMNIEDSVGESIVLKEEKNNIMSVDVEIAVKSHLTESKKVENEDKIGTSIEILLEKDQSSTVEIKPKEKADKSEQKIIINEKQSRPKIISNRQASKTQMEKKSCTSSLKEENDYSNVKVTLEKKKETKRSSNARDDKRISAKIEPTTSQPSTPKEANANDDRKSKRHRLKTILYQSPLPELAFITKLSASEASNSPKPTSSDDKLIVFYKNEYMAVRNAEGSFFLCQTLQNVYRSSPRISIRWLSEDKKDDSIFIPDFYDHTDIECVLTTVDLKRIDKGHLRLPKNEKSRIESILKKAIDVEKGITPRPDVTEENPDGLDISLYKDESQIEKKSLVLAGTESTTSSGSATKKRSSSKISANKRSRSKNGTVGKKSPNKKRKTLTKRKKGLNSDEDGCENETSEEESDTDYKPSRKRNTSNSMPSSTAITKSPRAQRSPLAKARAASPITPSTSSRSRNLVVQKQSPNTSSNSRLDRAKRRADNEANNTSDLTDGAFVAKNSSTSLIKNSNAKSKDNTKNINAVEESAENNSSTSKVIKNLTMKKLKTNTAATPPPASTAITSVTSSIIAVPNTTTTTVATTANTSKVSPSPTATISSSSIIAPSSSGIRPTRSRK